MQIKVKRIYLVFLDFSSTSVIAIKASYMASPFHSLLNNLARILGIGPSGSR